MRLLPAVGMKFFQDVLELEPGDRWQDELWCHIDESDVMFLFWSTAARDSEWVEKEWRYALEHKGDGYIRPIIIEGPPPVPPPPELSHLHFDDRVAYFLRASESAASSARQPAEPRGADEARQRGVAYVERMRSKGRSDAEIGASLRKAGWSEGQIVSLLAFVSQEGLGNIPNTG